MRLMLMIAFNPQQVEAIEHNPLKSHCLVIAGAGSGKTAVLIERIIYLQRTYDFNVWCMTFTRAAATEMRERYLKRNHELDRVGSQVILEGQGEDYINSSETLETFHIIARNILTHFHMNIPTVIDDWIPQATQLLLNQSKDLEIDLDAKTDWEMKIQFQKPDALLIDEFQDINDEQLQFCQAINPQHIFAVGDDDQAIYGFRGSNVKVIMSLDQYFSPLHTILLEKNYRSNQPILNLANALFVDKKKSLKKTLRHGRTPQDIFAKIIVQPRFIQSKTSFDEVEWIVDEIKSLLHQHPFLNLNSIAILVRLNRLVGYFQAALSYFDIPIAHDIHQGVQVLSIHASKGLQYPVVFIAGLEYGLFPHMESFVKPKIFKKSQRMAEEERLFYVAITRAETRLYLLHCKVRLWRGKSQFFPASPFFKVRVPRTNLRAFMLILHRVRALCMIMLYMAWIMIKYTPYTFAKRATQDAWIDHAIIPWGRWVLKYMGFKAEVKSSHNFNAPKDRHLFVIANHQSWGDIPAILLAFNQKLGFIAKVELSRIPILHYWMRKLGCIFVNRKKHRSAMRALQKLEANNEFTRIVLFPEGTRSKTGKLGNFKPGGMKIAWSLSAIIQPTIIQGTRAAWENRDHTGYYDSTITILPQIDIAELKSKDVTFDQFKKSLEILFRQELKEY